MRGNKRDVQLDAISSPIKYNANLLSTSSKRLVKLIKNLFPQYSRARDNSCFELQLRHEKKKKKSTTKPKNFL